MRTPGSASRPFEPFQPQDLAITLLGAYIRPHGRMVWSGGLVELLAEFGFSTGAARIALSRLVRRDLLARVRQGRAVYYALTPRSEELLAEGDRRIFSLGGDHHPARVWTVLWHAIPPEQRLARAQLAKRLRFLGFGSVQDGTWVSPHDREEEVAGLVRSLGVAEHAGVLIGRPAASLDFRAFVARAWDLDGLSDRYRAFVQEFGPYRSRAALGDREAFLARTRLVHVFRGFPFLDPELPSELMSEPGHRAEAVSVFHELYEALAPGAQRHFDAVSRWRQAASAS